MLHLFDKVYITSDAVLSINLDRVVISENYGVQMLEALDRVAYGELISYGTSVNSLLENSSFSQLIDTIKAKGQTSNKRIVIFADDLNFSKFLSIWFKSIFANISADAAWSIISQYIEKEKFLNNSRLPGANTSQELFPLVTQEQFLNEFTTAAGHTLNDMTASLSFEILLANYRANSTYKAELKSSIKKILSRSLSELAIEVKYSYVKNFKKPTYPSIAKDNDFFTNSTVYPSIDLGRVSTANNSVNLITSSDSDIVKFKNISTELLLNWEQFIPQAAIFTLLAFIDKLRQDNFTDADLETLINYEKTSLGTTRFYSSADEETINIYFLDYVLNTQAENLSGYALK
jgi:hypothetical protein